MITLLHVSTVLSMPAVQGPSMAMFPSALFKHVLIDLQGLCSLLALAQLGKLILLLLRVLGCPQPIILNPLSVIIGFRNISQPQWRLSFLSASDGHTALSQYPLCRPKNVQTYREFL